VASAQDRCMGQGAAVGVVHAPMPLQVLAGVSMSAVQEAPGQVAGVPAVTSLQAPAPSHVPLLPQGGAGVQRVSAPFGEMREQVPLACPVRAMLQAMQVAPQAVLQQKLSTHLPPLHCRSVMHP
jgi:hypothetical protein